MGRVSAIPAHAAAAALQVIPTPSHVLDRISPICFPVSPRVLRVFAVSPRRFQLSPSRNPGPKKQPTKPRGPPSIQALSAYGTNHLSIWLHQAEVLPPHSRQLTVCIPQRPGRRWPEPLASQQPGQFDDCSQKRSSQSRGNSISFFAHSHSAGDIEASPLLWLGRSSDHKRLISSLCGAPMSRSEN